MSTNTHHFLNKKVIFFQTFHIKYQICLQGENQMNQEKRTNQRPHNLIMENRKTLSISGVTEVESFDDQTVILYTDLGQLTIRGNELHLDRLSTDAGDVGVTGNIYGLMYTNDTGKGDYFSRIFK